MYIFRKPIIKALLARGDEVVAVSDESNYFKRIEALGARPLKVDFARHSTSLWSNLVLLIRLARVIRKEQPDIVHSFTHKPAVFGSLAARFAGVSKIFVTITGLGTVFVREDWKTRLVRFFLLLQYRLALRFVNTVFFQNPDDMALFQSSGLIDSDKSVLTAGSGLDLSEFNAPTSDDVASARVLLGKEIGLDLRDKKVVIYPARGVPEKGVFEYYEASRMINELFPNQYVFVHLGLVDDASGDRRLTKEGLTSYASECFMHYLGFKDDIQAYMRAADVVALPSKYREGIPRSLIEALGLGKVIVTTDMPGCRETVIDGWNGFVCKPGDVMAFVSAILAVNDELIGASRARSRQYCEARFDANGLVRQTFGRYGIS